MNISEGAEPHVEEFSTFRKLGTKGSVTRQELFDRIPAYREVFDCLRVDEPAFGMAVYICGPYNRQPRSFTDMASMAHKWQQIIDRILSIDDEYGGSNDRFDPRNA